MSKLTGKIAVVTGGSAGIGQGIVARFVAAGDQVFITGLIEQGSTTPGEPWCPLVPARTCLHKSESYHTEDAYVSTRTV